MIFVAVGVVRFEKLLLEATITSLKQHVANIDFEKEVSILKGCGDEHVSKVFASMKDQSRYHLILSPWCDVALLTKVIWTNSLVFLAEVGDDASVGGTSTAGQKRIPFLFNTMSCVCRGLEYLHRSKIRHGDLKLSNIMFYSKHLLIWPSRLITLESNTTEYPLAKISDYRKFSI